MYLLDTNALIFYLLGDKTMSKKVRKQIEENECYYSYVSLWEIAIKQKTGKLKIPYSIQDINSFCEQENFIHLPVTPDQIEQTKNLPLIHRDPFDRIMIAQAKENDLTLITSDQIIPAYDVDTLW